MHTVGTQKSRSPNRDTPSKWCYAGSMDADLLAQLRNQSEAWKSQVHSMLAEKRKLYLNDATKSMLDRLIARRRSDIEAIDKLISNAGLQGPTIFVDGKSYSY